MLKWLFQKFTKSTCSEDEDAFRSGYQYALSELLSSKLTPEKLKKRVEVSKMFGGPTHFDYGIEAAIRDWQNDD